MRSRIATDVTTDDIVALTVALAGDLCFKVGARDFELKPGAAAFGGGDARGVLDVRSNARFLTIGLSRRLLAPLVPNVADLGAVPIPVGSQATRLLLGYMQMLDAEDTIDTPEARHLAVTHICDLVALTLGGTKDTRAATQNGGARAARLAAIKSDILDNLARPDLSAPAVAARHGVTRRYVDKLFELEGMTFSEFVVGQRLAQAHRMLTDPRFANRTVNAIALDVGFSDLSYFNRTFRRRYGATPSDVRQAAKPEN